MTGIYYRYSDYLETNVEVGVAADKVVSVKFTDSPEGQELGDGDSGDSDAKKLLDDIFDYLKREEVDFSDYNPGLTVTGVERRALERTKRIPRGKTLTYDELRRGIGADETELKDVKDAIDSNPVAILLPSHRIVGEDGIGGFTGPIKVKRRLLDIEGAEI